MQESLEGCIVVEQIQDVTYPQSAVYATPLRLSPYVRFALILLTGFAIANIGTRILALTATALPNPFAAYADILPGQPANAIETRAFSCPSNHNYYQAPSGLYCTFTPVDGVFSNVTVVILGSIIQQTNFIMRENKLTIGDLELIFETRAFHKFPHTAYFALLMQGSFALAKIIGYGGQFSVFIPVGEISFTRIGLPIS